MFATRTRLARSKGICRLNAEVLEDRYVLSAFGLTPIAHELISGPPLAALVQTAAEIAPEGHVNVGVSPVAAEPFLGGLLGLFKQDNASPVSSAPVGSEITALSAPTLTLNVALGVAGIHVALQAEARATSIVSIGPGLNAAVSVGANNKVVAAVGTSGAGPNVEVNLAGGKQSTVAFGASAQNGPNAAPPIDASGVPVVPAVPVVIPLVPQVIANGLFAESGRDVGQPVGNLQGAFALGGPVELFPAGIGESPAPVVPDLRDTEPGIIDREPLAPQSSGLLTDAIPIDLAAMENALQHFLDQFDDLQQGVGGWVRNAGPTPWVFTSLAVVAVAGEIMRRRLQQGQAKESVTETARRDALRLFPAFNNLKEA